MNNKLKRLFIVTAVTILCYNLLICQTTWLEGYRKKVRELGIDPDNKQQVLDSLNSLDSYTRYYLYHYCSEARIVEALPIFKQLFYTYSYTPSVDSWYPSRFVQDRNLILDAVVNMKGDGFQQEFRMELDSLKKYLENDYYDFIKFASYLMKKHQDDYGYSTMIRYYTSRDSLVKYKPSSWYLEPFFNSSHKAEVIEALRFVCRENPDRGESHSALIRLKDIPDPQFESFAHEISKTDTSESIRYFARLYLEEIKSPLYWTSIMDALKFETEKRSWYYEWLLESKQVWAYKYVVDLFKNNTYPADSTIIKDALETYHEALRPSLEIPIKELIDSLRASLPQVQNYNWIGDQRFVRELDNTLKEAIKELSSGDSIGCAQELESFHKTLKRERYDTKPTSEKGHKDKKYVTEEGYTFLTLSSESIVDRVINLPRYRYATHMDLIAQLRTHLRTEAQAGTVGGEKLIRGLEFMIDDAQKCLEQKDSIGTSLHIMLFQQIVRQVYELTKKHSVGKFYVKPNGYISLYYRAEYILYYRAGPLTRTGDLLRTLPEPFGKPMPKMDKDLEKELKEYEGK